MKTKMRIEIPDEKERELPPPGSHIAACFAVVDLGTQNTPYGAKHQVYLSWELRKRNSQGTQHQIGKFYTLTNDARGTLRQDLSGWFGHELEDHEFKGFDLLSLIGRTARINGTAGTDHGTATVALLAGGALKGGRVIADWPGLKDADLYQSRDLKPTTDLRAVMKGLLGNHLRVPESALAATVFPDSAEVRPIPDLVA